MAICTRRRMSSGVKAGEVVFTTSQNWTVPKGVKVVDVFIVSGGCGGGCSSINTYDQSWAGGGGGGGSVYTATDLAITPESKVAIVIGAGGKGAIYGRTGALLGGGSSVTATTFSYYFSNADFGSPMNGVGGKGMSGGGGGAAINGNISTSGLGGDGGTDGSDGRENGSYSGPTGNAGGAGSGTTTRAFKDSSKALFAGGGGGGGVENEWTSISSSEDPGAGADGGGDGGWGNGFNATANTGSGGGGAGTACYNDGGDVDPMYFNGGDGGSGIVIIRWKEQ